MFVQIDSESKLASSPCYYWQDYVFDPCWLAWTWSHSSQHIRGNHSTGKFVSWVSDCLCNGVWNCVWISIASCSCSIYKSSFIDQRTQHAIWQDFLFTISPSKTKVVDSMLHGSTHVLTANEMTPWHIGQYSKYTLTGYLIFDRDSRWF